MGSPVTFQQFDQDRASDDPELDPQCPVPASAGRFPDDDGAGDDGAENRVLGDDAANPIWDPEAASLAVLERLAGTLSVAAAEQARLRDGLIDAVAQALGAAAEEILPALARAGFAARVAEMTAEIARRGDWSDLTLSMAPDDRVAIEAALNTHDAVNGLSLDEDARLEPGEAQLAWPAGGAQIDVQAIAAAAIEEFGQHLKGLVTKGD